MESPVLPMNAQNPILAKLRAALATLQQYRWLWLAPALLGLVAGAAYARLRPAVWEASQGLLLRDEALSNLGRQGRIDSSESRKTAQETILEIARNRLVVAAALKAIGPPAGGGATLPWPSEADVTDARDEVAIRAPKGSEFGHSEVVYLTVRRESRARALALAAALCEQLDARLSQLRRLKAQGLVAELERTAQTARSERELAAQRLQSMESQVGSDLGELRTMVEAGSGDSNLRVALNKIKDELRQAQAKHAADAELQALLAGAVQNPSQLLAMPSQLLDSQPALRRLKEGLVDAQLRTSQILGRTSREHPLAQAAVEAEEKIRQNLRGELETALRSAEAASRLSSALVASTQRQLADVQLRLNRLAGLRVTYSNLAADLRDRSQRLEAADRALADAHAAQGASQASSLLTRMDSPQTGDRPLGPGSLAIVFGGLGGGLGVGLGLVLLLTPSGAGQRRRWSDYLYGRRKTDLPAQGRRASDAPLANERRSGHDRRAAS